MNVVCAIVVAIAAWSAAMAAQAQTIYRCGNTYTRVPCSGGKAIETDAGVTAAQRAEARQIVRDQRRLADDMARERRAEEAAGRAIGAASVGPVKPPAPAASAAKKKKAKPKKKSDKSLASEESGDFVVRVPKAKSAST